MCSYFFFLVIKNVYQIYKKLLNKIYYFILNLFEWRLFVSETSLKIIEKFTSEIYLIFFQEVVHVKVILTILSMNLKN